jgi:cytochrome b
MLFGEIKVMKSVTPKTQRIWDLPTRIFHWLLVAAFMLVWLSQGDDRYLDIHVFAGYLILGLLIFRIGWGFGGSHYACFNSFVYGWRSVWHYLIMLLTPQRQHFIGHNPLGGWAILVILGLGLMVTLTGLLTLGGKEQHGPLAGLISFAWGDIWYEWHDILAWLMLGFVGIHILGVLVASCLHQENLIKAMITGYKNIATEITSVANHSLLAISLILVVLISGGSYFHGYFIQTPERPYLPFIGPQLPNNAAWQEACDECHLAYHPTLLPIRSWQRLLNEQHQHFEEDLDLDAETLAELRRFAGNNAAETHLTEAAWQIAQTTPLNQAPVRITVTAYWQEQHQEIPNPIWQHPLVKFKGHCDACHLDAEQGTFEDAAMRLPKNSDFF